MDRRFLLVPLAFALIAWTGHRERQERVHPVAPPLPAASLNTGAEAAARPAAPQPEPRPCAVIGPADGQLVAMYNSQVLLTGEVPDGQRMYLVITDPVGGRWLWATNRLGSTYRVQPQIGLGWDTGKRFLLQAAIGPAGLYRGEVSDDGVFTQMSDPVEVIRR